jgi:photosystem II stability/assembly factor-like uncharacterized protein
MIQATTDGGVNWKQQLDYPKSPGNITNFFTAQFLDTNRGWVAGSHGTILATTDGGVNWKLQFIHASIQGLWSIHFVDGNRGWAGGWHTLS